MKSPYYLIVAFALALAAVNPGCGGDAPLDATNPDVRDAAVTDVADASGDASDAGNVDVHATDAVRDPGPDEVDTGNDGYCDDWTFIDFPCEGKFECTGLTSFNKMRTYWCDIPCCSGGSCDLIEGATCPEGTACYDGYYDEDGPEENPCRGDECNVAEGRPCPEGQFCETIPGNCGGSGVCQPVYDPDDSGTYPTHEIADGEYYWDFICACDGTTYFSVHERLEAGVSPDHEGPCCNPERLGLSQENAEEHGTYLVCVEWSESSFKDQLPEDLRNLLALAEYGNTGMVTGCLGGQSAYIGKLTLTESGAIDPVQYDALCRLGSFHAVRALKGQPADYCETLGCYSDSLLTCGQECPSACGCCLCRAGEMRCRSDTATETCTVDGCWGLREFCPNNQECVDDEQGVSCRPVN